MIRSRRFEESLAYLNRALDYDPKNVNAAALFGTMMLEWAKSPALEKTYDVGGTVSLVTFSKTGRYCVVSLLDGRWICFDIAAGWRKTFEVKQTDRSHLATFSDDESRVAAANAGEVTVRQVSDGTVIDSVHHVGSGYITCISFQPSGSLLAIGDSGGTFSLLRVGSDRPPDFKTNYEGEIRHIEFSPDGLNVLIATKTAKGGSVFVVSLATHEVSKPELSLNSPPELARWTGERDKYFVLGNDGLRVISQASSHVITFVPLQKGVRNALLALSPDNRWVAFADYSVVRLFEVTADGNLDLTKEKSYSRSGAITGLRFCDDGRLLFSSSTDGTGYVYDIDSATLVW